jgi:hypothetical protein
MTDAGDRNLYFAVRFKTIERILDPCNWDGRAPLASHENVIAFEFQNAILPSGDRVDRTVLE